MSRDLREKMTNGLCRYLVMLHGWETASVKALRQECEGVFQEQQGAPMAEVKCLL